MVKDVPADLLTLESTKPVDKDGKFRGWSDWETLVNDPMHMNVLTAGLTFRDKGCSRSQQVNIIISKYTLFGKSFSLKLSQLTII
jgi:hypothetical protein